MIWVVPAVVTLVVLALWIPPVRTFFLVLLAVVAVLGLVYVVVMPRWRYRVHRWEVTEGAVYTASGWLWQEWRVAPMSRIQTVDSLRGPIQQAFGLTGITVTTASASGAIKINGLDSKTAEDLVEKLTAATQLTPGDAT